MEYCCHVWAGTPNCYLELSDKLQKRICKTVGLSCAASLELLAHCRNVASLSHFYRHTEFCNCESFLESYSPDILALCETNLDDAIDSCNISEELSSLNDAHMEELVLY